MTATFQNLTIRNGFGNELAGGIANDGALTIKNAALAGNTAGVGIAGVYNEGTLTVINSTFSDNIAVGGGAIVNAGTLTVTDSTFSGNFSEGGGGISNDGTLIITNSTFSQNGGHTAAGISNSGTVTVISSTFSDNSGGAGGGVYNEGTLTVINSTFSDNIAEIGGIDNFGILSVINSTFSDNSGEVGGIGSGGTLTVTNSTFAGNSVVGGVPGAGGIAGTGILKNTIFASSGSGGNCSGTFTDNGYNISDDTSCGFTASGSRNSTNPLFDPAGLKNNGGPTQTIALDSESPAIDAIPLADCTDSNSNPIHTDQRGALRPDPGEVACDIGAYEFQDFAGQAKCESKTDSALVQQYGSLSGAASAYRFSTVKALKAAVRRSCGG